MAVGGGVWPLKKVARNLRNCVIFDGHFQAVWPLLKRAEFLVSGHYHNIIMGSMVGCPFIPFHGVSHKVQGLVELLQWPHRKTYNPTVLSREIVSIVQDAELIVARREGLSAHLLEQSARLAASATGTAILLRDALGTS
jgi:polysaccharide pyruvyl transferase WcaK-like protein